MNRATPQKLLFISNGHGEDNHSSHIIRTLNELRPSLEIRALPIVGQGQAYRQVGVPVIGPTKSMPSGGFTYMNRWLLLDDFRAGLATLAWRQLRTVRLQGAECNLVAATGDTIGQAFAFASGRPFVSFISPLSALYEGRLRLEPLLRWIFKSDRCRSIVTRDAFTARDLQRQGWRKARFGGIPSLDRLVPTGKDLHLRPNLPMVSLLPGSRMPEARRNLILLLTLVLETARLNRSIAFRAALVPVLMAQLPSIAASQGWCLQGDTLSCLLDTSDGDSRVEVVCFSDAFSDILCQTALVIGMAGLAVDQAVALGKPVIQIPGEGPQFTYAFAEAQNRLLGLSAQTIGSSPATPAILQQAARCMIRTLADDDYLRACAENGRNRFGPFGASTRIATLILRHLDEAAP